MSFKPDISAISICNEALALLPADPIQSLTQQGLEARECRRFYPGIVAKWLERHHWNLAIKRAALAPVSESGHHGYLYSKPVDLAYPVSLTAADGRAWHGWSAQGNAYWLGGRRLFEQSGRYILSTVPAAVMEYTSYDITEADFTARLKDVIVLDLAAKICHPITKDTRRAQELAAQAEFEGQRAIASDLNRNQPTYGNSPSETEIVRGSGWDQTWRGTGWPINPLVPGADPGNHTPTPAPLPASSAC